MSKIAPARVPQQITTRNAEMVQTILRFRTEDEQHIQKCVNLKRTWLPLSLSSAWPDIGWQVKISHYYYEIYTKAKRATAREQGSAQRKKISTTKRYKMPWNLLCNEFAQVFSYFLLRAAPSPSTVNEPLATYHHPPHSAGTKCSTYKWTIFSLSYRSHFSTLSPVGGLAKLHRIHCRLYSCKKKKNTRTFISTRTIFVSRISTRAFWHLTKNKICQRIPAGTWHLAQGRMNWSSWPLRFLVIHLPFITQISNDANAIFTACDQMLSPIINLQIIIIAGSHLLVLHNALPNKIELNFTFTRHIIEDSR